APSEPSALALHDALPIFHVNGIIGGDARPGVAPAFAEGHARVEMIAERMGAADGIGTRKGVLVVMPPFVDDHVAVEFVGVVVLRSEEHTSELQSREKIVC